jgi:hypothetical protein
MEERHSSQTQEAQSHPAREGGHGPDERHQQRHAVERRGHRGDLDVQCWDG